MPTYVVPQTLVFQDLETVTSANIQPLNAFIAGGHAYLLRNTEADEKPFGNLGTYDRLNDTTYAWPQRPTGGTVDLDFTRVYIDDALLRYYSDPVGSGDSLNTVSGETNRIKATATNYQANGVSYPLDSQFQDRDVQVGDFAKVRAVVNSATYDLCTYVAGLEADTVAAVVGTAVEDVDNQVTTVASNDGGAQTAGGENCVAISAVSHASYDGLADGDVTETYTITVTESSAGGDATTAKLRVTSASGNDDVAEVTPAAFAAATAIGTRGATVTWGNSGTGDCSLSAENAGIDQDDFVVGQVWTVQVTMAYTAVDGTSGGDYTGAVDDTYIVEVSRGGTYAGATKPQVIVRTTKGNDVSGPHDVSDTSAITIGTKTLTVAFDETALVKGDRFYIDVTAEADGPVRTIILGHNFDEDVIDNGVTEVDLSLYIRKDIEVSENRVEAAPIVNWTQSATEITLTSGITAYDESWTDGNGDPEALPVHAECGYSTVYITARYWESALCGEINAVSNVSALDTAISGPLHPDNELKWGVYKALQNSNGRAVSFSAICDPSDTDNWADVLELIDGRRDTYGLVPLTKNLVVWGLFQAHVSGQSSAEFGRWRNCWFNAAGVPEKVVVDATTSSDTAEVLAVLEDDPLTSGTQYTYLRVPAGNGNFVTNEVAAEDIVRLIYNTDGFGTVTYSEFVVDAVINEDTIRLATGHSAAINVPEKMEIWKNLTATEQAAELALTSGYSDRRVKMLWPDQANSDGYTVEGYHLCAAYAGLASGVAPHQGLTHLELAGFVDMDRTTKVFNRTQLNTMAAGGVFIVTQDLEDGSIFSRHAVTTADTDDIALREEMITRNLDSISFYFLDTYAPYIGISNVTSDALVMLRAETSAAITVLESSNSTDRLGPQLISGTISELRVHATLKDRVVIALDLALPFPLNNIEAHLKLVA